MKRKTKSKCDSSKKVLPWRIKKNKWTDTLFDSKLLSNPSLMTNCEIATAMSEFQEWRSAKGKYDWREDPIKERKEDECPFSSAVWKRIMCEAIVRLKLIGDLSCGRFKSHV